MARLKGPITVSIPAQPLFGIVSESENVRQNPTPGRLTVQIDETVIERARNAVYWTPGLTLSAFVEKALVRALFGLEEQRGEAFPNRQKDLKAGRPVKCPK